MINNQVLLELKELVEKEENVTFGLLFGSRVIEGGENSSDWDFAFFWKSDLDFWEKLGVVETLRINLAKVLGIDTDQVDMVDLNRAGLSIFSSVVEEGIPIKGEGTLALERFYQRVWALEEEFHWRLTVENPRISV